MKKFVSLLLLAGFSQSKFLEQDEKPKEKCIYLTNITLSHVNDEFTLTERSYDYMYLGAMVDTLTWKNKSSRWIDCCQPLFNLNR